MLYTIKQVCEKLNLTSHTVRHYTDSGLVPYIKRDKNGNRLFDDKDLNWLLVAKFLRESGMSIKEIKSYFDLCIMGFSTFQKRFEILKKLQAQTEEELNKIQFRQKCINEKIKHCEDILNGKCIDDCNPLNW